MFVCPYLAVRDAARAIAFYKKPSEPSKVSASPVPPAKSDMPKL